MFSDGEGNLHLHELKTGLWKHNPSKLEGMQKEMAFYAYLLRKGKLRLQDGKESEPFDGQTVTYLGWDHTKGDEPHATHSNAGKVYRFIEPVRTSIIQKMLADLRSLVAVHLRYAGDNDGRYFAIKTGQFATERLCEPWCRVKGFCSKYYRVLMPENLRKDVKKNV